MPDERPDDPAAFARALAEVLPAVHAAPLVERSYEPYLVTDRQRIEDLRPPSWARDRSVWERAFEVAGASAPEHAVRFIHRDYHQGNTVWEAGRLSGIVDWTCGCSGPPGIDLAHMRINLAWEFDLGLADTFLQAWRDVAGDRRGYHAYWDVLVAVDWIPDPPEPEVPPGGHER
jgi:aminoglycoside phosphotransferase (APT) family kinase protein